MTHLFAKSPEQVDTVLVMRILDKADIDKLYSIKQDGIGNGIGNVKY